MAKKNIITPGMKPGKIVSTLRKLNGVMFTSVGMRDAGQSDYKNRLRMFDLQELAPNYNKMGLFSAECHGGARWHVGIMNRRENPFDELRQLRKKMPNVLLQTLIRETNLWGYRPYSKNVIEYVVDKVDIDVWRCFSFLNDISNMRVVAEGVMNRGKLFQPAISFTQAEWTTNKYYLGVVDQIVDLCSGVDEIILCIKDMAGVGTPERIRSLVDAILQAYPDLVIQYHRHTTDGLAAPALLAAAEAGAKIVDVQEDTLLRFYGHSPILGMATYFKEAGIKVVLDEAEAETAVQKVRQWIGQYDWAESPFRGFDYTVTRHRMPGGAFPSSFEQAGKGGFIHLMPYILEVMAKYNKIIKYFDVTPGSQITWVTCSGIVNRYDKERGIAGVKSLIALLTKFVDQNDQNMDKMSPAEQEKLLKLYSTAPGDFQNLLLGKYGRLPQGWPADWVYQSAFGDEWQIKKNSRAEISPIEQLPLEDLDRLKSELTEKLGREPDDEEFILYLMHPKDAVDYLEFVDEFGIAPKILNTHVWRNGLNKPGEQVEFNLGGKPYTLELVSIGGEKDGHIHVVMKINNKTKVYNIATERAVARDLRIAKGSGEIGAPTNGSIWRIGNPDRGAIRVGDIVHKGEEICNLEAMKMETAIRAPFDAQVTEVAVKLNDIVIEGQLLMVIENLANIEPDNVGACPPEEFA